MTEIYDYPPMNESQPENTASELEFAFTGLGKASVTVAALGLICNVTAIDVSSSNVEIVDSRSRNSRLYTLTPANSCRVIPTGNSKVRCKAQRDSLGKTLVMFQIQKGGV